MGTQTEKNHGVHGKMNNVEASTKQQNGICLGSSHMCAFPGSDPKVSMSAGWQIGFSSHLLVSVVMKITESGESSTQSNFILVIFFLFCKVPIC
jgi:hypothetical protein